MPPMKPPHKNRAYSHKTCVDKMNYISQINSYRPKHHKYRRHHYQQGDPRYQNNFQDLRYHPLQKPLYISQDKHTYYNRND